MTDQRTSPNDDLREQIAEALRKRMFQPPGSSWYADTTDAVLAVVEPALAERDAARRLLAEMDERLVQRQAERDEARRVIAAVEALCDEALPHDGRLHRWVADADIRAVLTPTDATEAR